MRKEIVFELVRREYFTVEEAVAYHAKTALFDFVDFNKGH
jgi:hypothetical protein